MQDHSRAEFAIILAIEPMVGLASILFLGARMNAVLSNGSGQLSKRGAGRTSSKVFNHDGKSQVEHDRGVAAGW